MDDFYVHVIILSFCLYLSSFTKVLPLLLIQYSNYLGKLPLHLGLFHPPIYPHGPPEYTISSTIFPGVLHVTLNESISVSPAYVWTSLVLVYTIDGLHTTLNESISATPASVSVYYCKTGWRSLSTQGGIELWKGRAWNYIPSYYFPSHCLHLFLCLTMRNSHTVCSRLCILEPLRAIRAWPEGFVLSYPDHLGGGRPLPPSRITKSGGESRCNKGVGEKCRVRSNWLDNFFDIFKSDFYPGASAEPFIFPDIKHTFMLWISSK